MTLPTFLVIGAERAGTTWLHERLAAHPDIYLPSTKEAHFFNERNSNLLPRDTFEVRGLAWYERLFRGWTGESAVGEVTPVYLCDLAAPERIRSTLPAVRLVCSLRNPIDRAWSHYWMARAKGHIDPVPFEEIIEADDERIIRRGDYREQLERYTSRFPSEQLFVAFFEQLVNPRHGILPTIERFLGVAPRPVEDAAHRPVNAAVGYRSPASLRVLKRTARFMRQHRGTDTVLDVAKRAGITQRVRALNETNVIRPSLEPHTRRRLAERYAPGVSALEEALQVPTPWADFR